MGSAAPEPTAVGAADSQLLCLGDLIPDKTVPLLTPAQGYHVFEDVSALPCLHVTAVKIYLKQVLLLFNRKTWIQNSTNLMYNLTK